MTSFRQQPNTSRSKAQPSIISDGAVLVCAAFGAFALVRGFILALAHGYVQLGLGTVSRSADGAIQLIAILAGVLAGWAVFAVVRRRFSPP